MQTVQQLDAAFGEDEAQNAYRSALVDALRDGGTPTTGSLTTAAHIIGEWLGFLESKEDVDSIVRLAREFPADTWDWRSLRLSKFVREQRLSGNFDEANRIAILLVEFYERIDARAPGADVLSEWAQALDESGRRAEGLTVCEFGWRMAWTNESLANQHSLMLERDRRWEDAIDVCDRWLALKPKSEQIKKRRRRCAAKALTR